MSDCAYGHLDMTREAIIERMIECCYRQLIASKDHDVQMHWWSQMGYYLKKRSPETIRQMEREKGLA